MQQNEMLELLHHLQPDQVVKKTRSNEASDDETVHLNWIDILLVTVVLVIFALVVVLIIKAFRKPSRIDLPSHQPLQQTEASNSMSNMINFLTKESALSGKT
jgi:hypothetical protein